MVPIAIKRIAKIDQAGDQENDNSSSVWIEGFSSKDLHSEQLKDQVTKTLIEWKEYGPPERHSCIEALLALLPAIDYERQDYLLQMEYG